jgi:hypothetical protein
VIVVEVAREQTSVPPANPGAGTSGNSSSADLDSILAAFADGVDQTLDVTKKE